ncbi:5-formyltetrahydrofolate cyclo-ligase [Pilimelia anulata]|uniref:5-formyltetrahydrofolate cyclo-ligase n=1 Tax=Pilimelia anulata TaxID=53371 RepID=A0A8J3F850_9ACTN|nr:5-formyltetrahydrofolate cyclo-ligase [Pilimelia anulata]GGJ92182.1 5-formyltetrahydrofolate cyclo-ligase [Pilimelia anulata]
MSDFSETSDVSRKQVLRTDLLARRRALAPAARLAAAAAVTAHLTALLGARRPAVVAAYAPVGAEPGGPDLPAVLRAALPGATLLLPVLLPDLDLDWAAWDGQPLTAAARGLREPAGPRRGPAAVAGAELVVVPALAVDRRGRRLGRGGGSYDRALARATGLTVALLYDGEWVDAVPAEPHDRPVRAVITPTGGPVRLDGDAADGALLALDKDECQDRR